MDNLTKLTEAELAAMIFERICRTDDCYNEPDTGIVLCVTCAHGAAVKAHPDLIAAKKRLQRLEAKTGGA